MSANLAGCAAVIFATLPVLTRRTAGRFGILIILGRAVLFAAAIGWTSVRITNPLMASALPEWWTEEVWPWMEYLVVGIGLFGGLLVAFALLGRSAGRKPIEPEPGSPTRTRMIGLVPRVGVRHMLFAMVPLACLFTLIKISAGRRWRSPGCCRRRWWRWAW